MAIRQLGTALSILCLLSCLPAGVGGEAQDLVGSSKPVSFSGSGVRLKPVLKDASRQAGLSLRAVPGLQERKLSLSVKDLPVSQLMEGLKVLSSPPFEEDAHWSKFGERGFLLWLHPKAHDAVERWINEETERAKKIAHKLLAYYMADPKRQQTLRKEDPFIAFMTRDPLQNALTGLFIKYASPDVKQKGFSPAGAQIPLETLPTEERQRVLKALEVVKVSEGGNAPPRPAFTGKGTMLSFSFVGSSGTPRVKLQVSEFHQRPTFKEGPGGAQLGGFVGGAGTFNIIQWALYEQVVGGQARQFSQLKSQNTDVLLTRKLDASALPARWLDSVHQSNGFGIVVRPAGGFYLPCELIEEFAQSLAKALDVNWMATRYVPNLLPASQAPQKIVGEVGGKKVVMTRQTKRYPPGTYDPNPETPPLQELPYGDSGRFADRFSNSYVRARVLADLVRKAESPGGVTLKEALDNVAIGCRYLWAVVGDLIVFYDAAWYDIQWDEIDPSLIGFWRDELNSREPTAYLQAAADIATLSEAQLQTLSEALVPDFRAEAVQQLFDNIRDARRFLIFYRTLAPPQQERLLSEKGLPLAEVSPPQRDCLLSPDERLPPALRALLPKSEQITVRFSLIHQGTALRLRILFRLPDGTQRTHIVSLGG